jgi:hypothetical protein
VRSVRCPNNIVAQASINSHPHPTIARRESALAQIGGSITQFDSTA